MTATLHLVAGSTGAGKTTYALNLAARERALRLSIDEWMTTLFGPDQPTPGSARGSRDLIKAAFSRGEGKLRLADGSELEIRFVAHTAGSDTVFFEVVRR